MPAARARRPAARSIASTSSVVVDFPLVPVTATIGTSSARKASSRSPQARARAPRVALARDARARHHEVEAGGVRERRAELALDLAGQPLEPVDRRRGALVRGQHARAALRAEARGAQARDAEAEHQHALSGEVEHQRSFSEESATSPRIAETIQKRTTIFCSGQPSFSK